VGKKKNNVWLIITEEIVAYVWRKGDIRTGQKLRKVLKRLGVSYDQIATDNWDSFLSIFTEDKHEGTYGGDRGEQLPAEA
jgi:IS1 family transposase